VLLKVDGIYGAWVSMDRARHESARGDHEEGAGSGRCFFGQFDLGFRFRLQNAVGEYIAPGMVVAYC